MIIDKIKNYGLYSGLRADFKEAFEFIKENKFEKTHGRYDFKNGIYYMVQNYETLSESETFIEAHRQYIDLQYVVSGKERHIVANITDLTLLEDYNEEEDISKYEGQGSNLILNEGSFVIYFPEDGHMPRLKTCDNPKKMTKIVFKIPVSV